MKALPGYPDRPPPGLNETIEAAGILLRNEGDVWLVSDVPAALAIWAAHDPLPYVVAEQKAALADHRWRVETGGCMFGKYPVHTTREAQGTITAALTAVQAGAYPASTQWKAMDGGFFPLPPDQVAALYAVMAEHVQACFAREAAMLAQIMTAATWQEAAGVDITSGFPSNPS